MTITTYELRAHRRVMDLELTAGALAWISSHEVEIGSPENTETLCSPSRLGVLSHSASRRCFLYLDEVAGMDVIDVAINRDVLWDQGMFTDAAHILNDA